MRRRAFLIVLTVVIGGLVAYRLAAQTSVGSLSDASSAITAQPPATPDSAPNSPSLPPTLQQPATQQPAGDSPGLPTANAAQADNAPGTVSHCIVSAIDEASVSAREAGVIMAINVREGQVVHKGDLLAQIDDAQPRMEKKKAEAERNAAKVKADSTIEKEFDTASSKVSYFGWQKELLANSRVANAVTEPEVKEAELKYVADTLKIKEADLETEIAKLTVEDKQAEVDAADEAINRRQVVAPLDGIVEEIVPHVGEWVKPGDPVVHLVRIDRLQVEGSVRSDQFNHWELRDKPVTVYKKLAHQTDPVAFQGRITFVDPLTDGNTFKVKASVENRLAPGRTDEWLILPGDNATMKIETN